jgi:dTDP-4-amino-4,6-dideoxygalactose transaminase
VDTGSSFLPSEVIAAFLWAQLENLDVIQTRRKEIWYQYYDALLPLEKQGVFQLPKIPSFATNNAHMFYLVFPSLEKRTSFITKLKENDILSVFHYLSLHKSDYYISKHDGRNLPNSDRYTDCLLRLPMFFELTSEEVEKICTIITNYT